MRPLLLSLFLVGCAAAPPEPDVETPTFHPPLPGPVQPCPVEWVVLIDDGEPYVAVTYDDNVTAAVCFKEYERYIHHLLRVVCSYREELDEPVCRNLP